jgi:YHS domain-containing protein
MDLRLELKGEDQHALKEAFHISRKSVEVFYKRYGLKSSRIGQRRYFSETSLLQLFKDHEKR